MCDSGKVEYKNPRAARSALTQIEYQRDERRKRKRREQAIYLCPQCLNFHLSSEPVDGESDRFR